MKRLNGFHFRQLASVCVAAFVAVGSSVAAAGPLSTAANALNNGSGPDGGIWRGSSTISNSDFTAIVDFAVFNPGDFEVFIDNEFPALGFTDPSSNRVVYAFQIEVPRNSPGGVQRLNAGFDLGVDVSDLPTPQAVVGSGDTSPVTSVFNDTSAAWDWGFLDSIEVGEVSDILYYTSVLNPQPDQLTVSSPLLLSQADSDPTDFASPNPLDRNNFVPEPSSLVICLLAACAATASRQRIS